MSINLIEIIFRNLWRKNILTTFPKFWTVASFSPQNDPIFTIFTKTTYFDPIDPINEIFTKFMSINLTEIILETFRENILDHSETVLRLTVTTVADSYETVMHHQSLRPTCTRNFKNKHDPTSFSLLR